MSKKIFFLLGLATVSQYADAQKKPNWDSLAREAARTELWEPVPPVVTPGATPADAPSDAIILFDGKHGLDAWYGSDDSTKPAQWTVGDGFFTVKKGTGGIVTKQKFTDYQLHLEWKIPEGIHGDNQGRGNSGIFLANTGKGDVGYEAQILDIYNNKTYVNGQTGSIYKQIIPLANANKKPGEWQVYDIVWTAPRFNKDGIVVSPAYVTIMLNGVLLQNHAQVQGLTQWIGNPYYKAHGACPIRLQDHGDPSEPISFRNIWLRPL
ncbi:DUF1080 domain-containing protein [Panacibacter sp. DH6]|uniref:DUF1080 domain-containing protein n=1 Tax=Panacibacter microcysteis TaxID=2793269 RepID=A0A931E8Y2_9BACT|nr:DUF1080 domain-containing protein [Panacibacter microcysteis]MBG9376389.1 DUF1080 domain-containing protein [Panacibacter microcysteis]